MSQASAPRQDTRLDLRWCAVRVVGVVVVVEVVVVVAAVVVEVVVVEVAVYPAMRHDATRHDLIECDTERYELTQCNRFGELTMPAQTGLAWSSLCISYIYIYIYMPEVESMYTRIILYQVCIGLI